jgi:hypothetical protein
LTGEEFQAATLGLEGQYEGPLPHHHCTTLTPTTIIYKTLLLPIMSLNPSQMTVTTIIAAETAKADKQEHKTVSTFFFKATTTSCQGNPFTTSSVDH